DLGIHAYPTRRSSDLSWRLRRVARWMSPCHRLRAPNMAATGAPAGSVEAREQGVDLRLLRGLVRKLGTGQQGAVRRPLLGRHRIDRKSTRLDSSHVKR